MISNALIWAALSSSGTPREATQLIVEFVGAVCLGEGDRMAAAQRLVPTSWEMTRDEMEENVTYSVDAPIPEQDWVHREWSGKLDGGAGIVTFRLYDYSAPTHRDSWSASVWVWSSFAIDHSEIERRLSMRFHPSGSAIPLYVAEIDDRAPDIEITATRYPFDSRRGQETTVTCSNVTGPPDRRPRPSR